MMARFFIVYPYSERLTRRRAQGDTLVSDGSHAQTHA
jgi:hypothetical protein